MNMHSTKRFSRLFISGLCLAVPAMLAQAQYPTKPIRFIVPFPPGGAADAFGRIIAPPLSEILGRPLVVENRPGAGANVGAEIAAKAQPDGYTVLLGTVSHAINVTLYRKLNYDVLRDFTAVSLTASTPNILVVNPSVPVKSVKDLVALAIARPGQLDYVSGGSGSSAHLAAALFISMTGAKMNHIPYKGGGPSMIALLSGEASVGFPTTPTAIEHVKSGKLRGLAVSSLQRSPFMPELPTISEAGVRGYEAGNWNGLLVPAGTPDEVVSRLSAEAMKALQRRDVKERLAASGLEAIGTTPGQFAAYIRDEIEKWRIVVGKSGARVE